eukprot:4498831-Prorocentrum_lima.AAC.1
MAQNTQEAASQAGNEAVAAGQKGGFVAECPGPVPVPLVGAEADLDAVPHAFLPPGVLVGGTR